jgi:uncharacterized repeat protein (TIGR02543 family)
MARVSILLITVAFFITVASITGMAGCGGGGPVYYLTVDSTAGGVVTVGGMTISGKTIVGCEAGGMLDLVATPATNYTFVNWTGDVSTIGNVIVANTTITMNGNYSITANFAIEIRNWYDLDAIRNNLGSDYIYLEYRQWSDLSIPELA